MYIAIILGGCNDPRYRGTVPVVITKWPTRTRYVARLCMNAASELMAIRINP
jgi:hypothetical protein